MDPEQIRLLQLAAEETDSLKLMALIEEVLARFEAQDDPQPLYAVLSGSRYRQLRARAAEMQTAGLG